MCKHLLSWKFDSLGVFSLKFCSEESRGAPRIAQPGMGGGGRYLLRDPPLIKNAVYKLKRRQNNYCCKSAAFCHVPLKINTIHVKNVKILVIFFVCSDILVTNKDIYIGILFNPILTSCFLPSITKSILIWTYDSPPCDVYSVFYESARAVGIRRNGPWSTPNTECVRKPCTVELTSECVRQRLSGWANSARPPERDCTSTFICKTTE